MDPELLISLHHAAFRSPSMLKILRTANGEVVFTLSGWMDAENVVELKTLFRLEAAGCDVVFDLKDLTLVDRDAVRFLARCEVDKVQLKNCPTFIRDWIARERDS
jgi:anti-anti-sigma regulatory factor